MYSSKSVMAIGLYVTTFMFTSPTVRLRNGGAAALAEPDPIVMMPRSAEAMRTATTPAVIMEFAKPRSRQRPLRPNPKLHPCPRSLQGTIRGLLVSGESDLAGIPRIVYEDSRTLSPLGTSVFGQRLLGLRLRVLGFASFAEELGKVVGPAGGLARDAGHLPPAERLDANDRPRRRAGRAGGVRDPRPDLGEEPVHLGRLPAENPRGEAVVDVVRDPDRVGQIIHLDDREDGHKQLFLVDAVVPR